MRLRTPSSRQFPPPPPGDPRQSPPQSQPQVTAVETMIHIQRLDREYGQRFDEIADKMKTAAQAMSDVAYLRNRILLSAAIREAQAQTQTPSPPAPTPPPESTWWLTIPGHLYNTSYQKVWRAAYSEGAFKKLKNGTPFLHFSFCLSHLSPFAVSFIEFWDMTSRVTVCLTHTHTSPCSHS